MVKVTLKIDGMMCGMCESHVNDVIRREHKVKKVTSSHSKGETVILCDCAPDEERLRTAIAKTGYTLLSVTQEPYEKQGFFARWKK
ncbi:MAG: heavy-metal-associated domain-containing protein [Clostridia bacterium]|nr:heavy-metal-associated domain-containing protein [Clostridia bacterium]